MNRCVRGNHNVVTSTARLLSTCGERKWTKKKPRGFIRSLFHVSPINAMEKFDTSVAFKINWHNAMEKIDTSD